MSSASLFSCLFLSTSSAEFEMEGMHNNEIHGKGIGKDSLHNRSRPSVGPAGEYFMPVCQHYGVWLDPEGSIRLQGYSEVR